MNEVASTPKPVYLWTQDPELMEAAAEIRGYYRTAKLSYLQIGKKLLEIKDRFDHGEWENFLETNTKMSVRGAQQCMQAYKTYGFDTRYIEIGQSKGIELLPLPEEEREKLLNENDVAKMSVRELKRKIQEAREEEQQKAREAVEAERTNGQIQLAKAKEAAEAEKQSALKQMREEMENREPEIVREPVADPALVAELELNKAEVKRLAEANREMMENAREWMREKADMQAEINENNDIIREQQGALNDAQNELLNLKSAANRGDNHAHDGEEMNLDTLQRAVREFMGWVSIMPQMHVTFSHMEEKERRRWREQVDTVRAWAKDTMKALETVDAEGGYTIE
jgi:hypothetical protein